MKKTGLCLSYKSTNYGTLLQAFATQHVIENLGYETEIIDYARGPGKNRHKRRTPGVYIKRYIDRHFPAAEKDLGDDDAHRMNVEMRLRAAEEFQSRFLHGYVQCEGFDAAREYAGQCDAVLVGSDQIWNPNTAASEFYTLRFVPKKIRKISYASSMGVSKYPFYLRGEVRSFLSRIDYLSVREETAAGIIRSITGRTPCVVCDPTCLLTCEEWERTIPLIRQEEEYIFCYFLGDCLEGKDLARQLSARMRMPIWGIMSNECASDDSYMDKVISGARADEFVNLIRGAAIVITDSFHGTMLSLIHEKPFYVFYRTRIDTRYQRNSRIDDALNRFGIRDRLVTDTDNAPGPSMDYTDISARLREFRTFSLSYLKNALP